MLRHIREFIWTCKVMWGLKDPHQKTIKQQLRASGRPGAGIFAALLTFVSFLLVKQPLPWLPMLVTMFAYDRLTRNIMTSNDIQDAAHDAKKGKRLALDHPRAIRKYWRRQARFILVLIAFIGVLGNPFLAMFMTGVWLLGLGYSFKPKWYPWNNLTVAFCSGSPAFAGTIYHGGQGALAAWFVFAIFASIMWVREVYKDIEDKDVDPGYKQTMVTTSGQGGTLSRLIALIYLPSIFILLYSMVIVHNRILIWTTAFLFAAIAFVQSKMFLNKNWDRLATKSKKYMDVVIHIILFVLIVQNL
ncbi:MAG: hypothetical protein CO030_00530 [Candidatus Magasanikbacteria bacterium CG_4_9_14_0_2_um_filter_42_11]|uniref:4-hydroxybenzoate octaprenyltransferase n=1 Tax=Candidatus Magasanikbacteria bacterium CG_4_9_14_0_2_um_filter_42_11 TaxID=1974643 RepID=A0A2M8FAZ2_9BACT|nr:MAG: hypothetical protein COU34_02520 [Candidatus Magasanikbacteria bacterium CG10_big_fil_rev_8_21_14_0_10_43_9]PIY92505.1 MAG: hypothetical protein COY70_02900 [Candidatus Magasanikbacteria bacterium CG_4_10_14_0_8_um_filter_42_12]PJC52878.1 MAG: hypothetical protein CO030_00530 [Candidatus Magasanikbacteria bacterium CG_4_9_14_0_2_um_filter_42_11]